MVRRIESGLVVSIAVSLLSGCAAQIARGRGFHFTVPEGYSIRSESDLHVFRGGIALAQTRRTEADYFIASLVITPVAESTPPFDPTNAALCTTTAEALAKAQNAAVIASGIVSTPMGKTCQIDVQANNSKQATRLTIIRGPKSLWALTCNHDPRDTEALTTCQQVIDGWSFDPEAAQ